MPVTVTVEMPLVDARVNGCPAVPLIRLRNAELPNSKVTEATVVGALLVTSRLAAVLGGMMTEADALFGTALASQFAAKCHTPLPAGRNVTAARTVNSAEPSVARSPEVADT